MLGRTVSHYRIVSQLGTGGMGVVYAAEDTRLGRAVALKFVPEELAKDRHVVDRLRVEARAASALNHANICTIYDVGEDEGRPYIVMELMKGQNLRDTLAGGPLKIRQVVDIGIQVADALDAAHTRGILHRDIKPANLFLTDRGQVKILDFGLAKLLPRPTAPGTTTTGSTADQLTAEGVTIGTVSYMSPEQVTGEQLDGRSDLFSLGVVLYECVTGHRPFTGKTSAVVFSAILNRAPVAPVVFNPEIPPRLQEVITNCLEKDRELRYQDAAGLRADLRRIKRDFETTHSEITRAVGSVTDATVGSAATRVGQATRESGVEAVPGSGLHASRGSRAAVTLTLAGIVALIGAASYVIWSRSAVGPQETNGAARVEATVRGRLELATASLEARNYRAALAYAEDVLRIVPDEPEAIRVRDTSRGMLARFDEAIARGDRLLAAGDVNGATEALEDARAIDPAAAAIGELSARLVSRFRSEAEIARQRVQQARATPPTPAPRQPPPDASRPEVPRPAGAEASTPASLPAPAPTPTPAPPTSAPPQSPRESSADPLIQVPATSPVVAPPAGTRPAVTPPLPQPTVPNGVPRETPPAATESTAPRPRAVEPAPPAPTAASRGRENGAARPPQAEDDDAAIRRVVATYARAIESKDVALFRTVKPNLTSEEQRRIEEGFRAVSSQRVAVTVLSIIRRGSEASVRLRRRDTIDAGGRQQTLESQQTLTLIRTDTGWVIREIG
jgi:hypothetical protein